MSSVAAYSAMTVYIMPGAELHIFNKFTALKKGINGPVMYKIIFVINIIIYMCLQHSNVL